jgi:hypothetical protein
MQRRSRNQLQAHSRMQQHQSSSCRMWSSGSRPQAVVWACRQVCFEPVLMLTSVPFGSWPLGNDWVMLVA